MTSTSSHFPSAARKSTKKKWRKLSARPDPRPDHPSLFVDLLHEALTEPGLLSSAYRAFHQYSLGNQLLAATQLMERDLPIAPIASFNTWKSKGRMVRKGQKAIRLFMPVTLRPQDRDDETGVEQEIQFQSFMLRPNWFSLDQTEGEVFNHEAKSPEWDKTLAMTAFGINEIPFEMLDGNCQGYASQNKIAINPLAALPHKTRFHEMAHVILGHTAETSMQDDERTPRNLREVEAESVAFIMCSLLDLPGQEEARGYVQVWLGDEQIAEKTALRIFATADKLLKAGQIKSDETFSG